MNHFTNVAIANMDMVHLMAALFDRIELRDLKRKLSDDEKRCLHLFLKKLLKFKPLKALPLYDPYGPGIADGGTTEKINFKNTNKMTTKTKPQRITSMPLLAIQCYEVA